MFFVTLFVFFVNGLLRFQIKRNVQSNSLSGIVQQATAQLHAKADIYEWTVVIHVPECLMGQSDELLRELGRRLDGFYCLNKVAGGWDSPVHGLMLEPICCVTAYASEARFIKHLAPILEAVYNFGVAHDEEAVALELFSPANRLLVVLPTK